MRKLRKPCRRRISVERLESRTVLAGSVTATLNDGVLTITGDASNNSLAISGGDEAGDIVIRGATEDGTDANRTKINNSFGAESFEDVTDIVVDLKGGNDELVVTDVDIDGNLRAVLGGGNDTVSIRSSAPASPEIDLNGDAQLQYGDVHVGGFVSVSGGSGADTLRLVNSDIDGSLVFSGDDGADRVIANGNLTDSQVGGNVSLTLGTGVDSVDISRLTVTGSIIVDDQDASNRSRVELNDVDVGGDVLLDLSDLSDFVSISGQVDGDVEVLTHAGNEAIRLIDLTADNVLVRAGLGDDRVVVTRADVDGTLRINTDGGQDEVILRNSEAANLAINTGSGGDLVKVVMDNVNATNATIRTGNGRDEVAIKDSLFGRLTVDTGNGKDSLSLEDVIVESLFEFDGGRGVDEFHDKGGNELPANKDVNNCDDDHDGDEDDDDFDGGDDDADGDED